MRSAILTLTSIPFRPETQGGSLHSRARAALDSWPDFNYFFGKNSRIQLGGTPYGGRDRQARRANETRQAALVACARVIQSGRRYRRHAQASEVLTKQWQNDSI